MYKINTFFVYPVMLTSLALVSASPVHVAGPGTSATSPLAKRGPGAHVNMYASNLCRDAVDQFDVVGTGGYRCVAVSGNKGSVSASGRLVIS